MSSTSKSTASMAVSGASSAATASSTVKQEASSPLPVVGFGMADVTGEVEEQASPEAAGSGQASTSAASSTDASDEVQLLYDVRGVSSSLPMRRCDRNDFKYLLLTTIGNDGSRPFKENATALHNDYCCVCNCLASECMWWTSAPSVPAGQRCHCNAFILKGDHEHNRTSLYWEVQALAKQEPLYAYLKPQTVREFTVYYKTLKTRMERAWRLYQAGEEVDGEFVHNFKHVTQCFQKHFNATRIEKREEHWKRKTSMLMAITTTIMKQSFKKPEHAEGTWDEEANGGLYNKMMLSLGSRWLTILATCPASDRHILMLVLREYVSKLYSKAKHAHEIHRGLFCVLYDLLQVGVRGKEILVIKSVCNLLNAILDRKKHYMNLPASDPDRRRKYFEIRFKDSFMIPFLSWVITNYPCTDEGIMKTARALLAKTSFMQEPSLDGLRVVFTHEGSSLPTRLGYTRFIKQSLSDDYTISGRAKEKKKQLEGMAEVLEHCGGEGISKPPTGKNLSRENLLKYAEEIKKKFSTNLYDGIKSRKRKRTQ